DPIPAVRLPGRLEQRGTEPFELWDGAHNPAGVAWLLERLPARAFVVTAAVLSDKGADEMLALLARAGDTLVATASASPRALPAADLARRAAGDFARVETRADPRAAVARARELAGRDGAVLVTGSLSLLADLSVR